MIMPFGKYSGVRLEDIPEDYLWWVVDTVKNRPRLVKAIEAHLDGLYSQSKGDKGDVGDVVAEWYRRMAMRFHPDRGGSTAAMQAINEANEALKAMLGL